MNPASNQSYINLANESSNQSMTSQDLRQHMGMGSNNYPRMSNYQAEEPWRGSSVPEQ